MTPTTMLRAAAVQDVLSIIDTLPSLTPDERQELRLLTWEQLLPMLMAASMTDTTREVQQLASWYDLPAISENPK